MVFAYLRIERMLVSQPGSAGLISLLDALSLAAIPVDTA